MSDEILKRDGNYVTVLGAITDDANQYIKMLRVDPTTGRLLVSVTGAGAGDVTGPGSSTDNAIVRFNGTDGTSIQNSGVIIDDSNNVTGIAVLGATGSRLTKGWFTDLEVTNAIAGDITGNAATATALETARTIGGVSFDGTANITVATATGGFTVSGGDLALGANNLTLTGSIAATGARVTKGWFTDLESTNMPTVGGTAILSSLTAPQFTTIELGHASDTTLARSSAGVISVEGVVIPSISSTNTLTNKTIDIGGEPGTDHTGVGVITSAFTLGATIAAPQAMYLDSSSTWQLTDADAVGTAGTVMVAICLLGGDSTDPTNALLQGMVRDDSWTWTPGVPIYLDTTTPGGLTATAPSGADDVVRVVGFAVTDDAIYFNPSSDHATVTG